MPRGVIRSMIAAFVVSRALIFGLFILGSQISFLSHDYDGKIWRTEIAISPARVVPELTRIVMVGDAWWYRQIAASGYELPQSGAPRNTWAFFPLFPLVTRVLRPLLDFPMAALLISNASFAAALFVFAALALRLGSPHDVVQRAVWYICIFPTSYFFSLPFTESLFLLVSALAFLFAAQKRWWAAALFGALAALTRVVGVLIFPALLVLPLQTGEKLSPRQLWLLAIPAALAGFCLFQYAHTGDALAFVHAQALWQRTGLAGFVANAHQADGIVVSRPWNFVLLNAAAAALLLVAAAGLVRSREWSYAAYTLLLVAVPLLSGSVQSIDRYALVAFPMFLWIARVTNDIQRERVVSAFFMIALGWLVALFTLRVDLALA